MICASLRWNCFLAIATSLCADEVTLESIPADRVMVELHEGLPNRDSWAFELPRPIVSYSQPAMAFVGYPKKYTPTGVIDDRSSPFLLRAQTRITMAADRTGEHELLLRAKGAARLFVDNKLIAETKFPTRNGDGHEAVPEVVESNRADVRSLPPGCQEVWTKVALAEGEHVVRLEAFVGGKGLRLELDELCAAMGRPGESLKMISPLAEPVGVTEEAWLAFAESSRARLADLDRSNRALAARAWTEYWQRRHTFAREVLARNTAPTIPPETALPANNPIDRFLNVQLVEANVAPTPLHADLAFLRRLSLDTVGVVPSRGEIMKFQAEDENQRRNRAIDRLLDDPRWADHWVAYWQDVLAENPGILKPELNNTGPFRWWIYEALRDNRPLDQFATELVMMEGSVYYGGPAGFGMATQNDVPSAAKAHVLAKAFLAMEMNCARCHDAPYHPYKQEELFSLAAMLHRQPIKLPKTSTVPAEIGGRKPLVTVSLAPGQAIAPAWPFAKLTDHLLPRELIWRNADDSRERLAMTLTSPFNERFAKVLVNRVWHRLLGRGLINPIDDWEGAGASQSHAGLLNYLAHDFVQHGYDAKHLVRTILQSRAYQREVFVGADPPAPELFAGPTRRRMSAEQLVDSLLVMSGQELRAELLTMDPETRRPVDTFLNLGLPRRAWQYTSLSNERDRPALALPVAQSVVDVLVAFGWRDSRQSPLTVREEEATAIQPLTLANGVIGNRAIRSSEGSPFTALALQDRSVDQLVDELFLRLLSRQPTADEQRLVGEVLSDGFDLRRTGVAPPPKKVVRRNAVSWSNHLNSEATKIKQELEREVLAGEPPTVRLQSQWRERLEDVLWSIVNSPEFVFVP